MRKGTRELVRDRKQRGRRSLWDCCMGFGDASTRMTRPWAFRRTAIRTIGWPDGSAMKIV